MLRGEEEGGSSHVSSPPNLRPAACLQGLGQDLWEHPTSVSISLDSPSFNPFSVLPSFKMVSCCWPTRSKAPFLLSSRPSPLG